MINNIKRSNISLFADDAKLFKKYIQFTIVLLYKNIFNHLNSWCYS